jgi:hypothetical protein
MFDHNHLFKSPFHLLTHLPNGWRLSRLADFRFVSVILAGF